MWVRIPPPAPRSGRALSRNPRRSAPRDGSRPDWGAVSGRRDPGQRQVGDLDVGPLEGDRHRVDLLGDGLPAGVDLDQLLGQLGLDGLEVGLSAARPCSAPRRRADPAADVLPPRPAARPSWPSRPPRERRPPSRPPRIDPADDSRSSRWRACCCSAATSAASVGRVDLVAQLHRLGLVLVAQLGDLGVGALVGDLGAARRELLDASRPAARTASAPGWSGSPAPGCA